ncbi:hypothetical protein XAXN_11635 [Xanthomonas axonopodis]|uniref:Uncharacterized protein n=2 Tax=Xanthomonas axonopodis TaxID=53413 RepID=A0A098Q2H2_9XANT|nr:hypothetical protein GW15_0201795 [Xanthomonas axonopodis pv. vasculorum]KPL48764.1 hypothetical protein XAXN_11635 [Xanthomonas axonopodis]
MAGKHPPSSATDITSRPARYQLRGTTSPDARA